MAKWDFSKLTEWHGPLPDEWLRERVQMDDRIKKLEANLEKALETLEDALVHGYFGDRQTEYNRFWVIYENLKGIEYD